jgi:Predicted aminoglycoside phosphotransferase
MEITGRTGPGGSYSPNQIQSESRPINDTYWNRVWTLVAVKMATSRAGGVVFSSNICIKYKGSTTLAEANAMQFVRQNTSIPVPTVYCSFVRKGQTYIVMERLPGKVLARTWRSRSEESKAKILSQLQAMIQELRRIPPPKHVGVRNVDGGPIYDCRLPKNPSWGPFRTIDDFHRQLRNGIEAHHINVTSKFPDIMALITFHERPWTESVFTHADLSSLNIMACGDEVVGIMDWETAGWFPPYWEYTTAAYVNPQNEFWRKEIDKFLTPRPYELKLENIRRRYFGMNGMS